MNLFFDAAVTFVLIGIFGFSHSVLASNKIKAKIAEKAGEKIAFYRLFYNLTSVIILSAALAIAPKPDIEIYDLNFPFDIVMFVLQAISFILLLKASSYFDVKEFLGVGQIIRYYKGTYDKTQLDEISELNITGWSRYCRHPIYFFSTLVICFRPAMNLFDLLICITFTIYFIVGAFNEEKKLVEKFGGDYLNYQKTTPMFIPYKIFKRTQ